MRIQGTSFYVGEQKSAVQNNSVFGGNLNRATDPIAEKKQRAKEQAMKIVSDAWAGEQKIDADMEERRGRIRELESEIGACNKEIKTLEQELTDTFQINKTLTSPKHFRIIYPLI